MLKEKIAKIEFIDLHAQRKVLGQKIPLAVEQVLEHGSFILGPEVNTLEEHLKQYTNAQDVITCSNGTDALRLILQAHDVKPGDAIFVPTFTFASTAEVVAQANATPIFIDICPQTYNIDLNSLQMALETLDRKKLSPKGIIAVDLFGLPANYPQLEQIAKQHNLWIIADAAQSFGGAIADNKIGSLAHTTATSFFPSKPLACYGDGGAIFTTDEKMSNLIRSLRNHGCGVHRYDHIHIGMNSRLDTLQAAILIEKLKIFPQELQRRQQIANFYNAELFDLVQVPTVPDNFSHAWGLYTIICETNQRDTLMEALLARGIPCNVYYRKPLHLQPAYAHFPRAAQSLAIAEDIAARVISLPMHPYLTDDQVGYVIEAIKDLF